MKKLFLFFVSALLSGFLFAQSYNQLSEKEKECLDFLYRSMPLSDRLDYDTDYFVKQVKASLLAKETFPWCKNIPDDIFKHFVLVYRVNNENLDTARLYMFAELRDRVMGLSMYDAALEVNHWCHEKVNYKASDGRTSSPLATMKTSWGRCGEESTFTVTALRSVGIPARQCYTPRWAHTDDNHAWVEVLIDGKWYYLGACEPEAKLNTAWFTAPAKRAMMVHTTVFGKYSGAEEKNFEAEKYSKINLLGNYAPVKKLTVRVKDRNGKPLKDAEVSFGLYNYAEYYPLSKVKTDREGKASLTTGFGDLIIWAKTDKYFAQKQAFANETDVTLILGDNVLKDAEFLITPPEELPIESLSDELIRKNNERLLTEDSIRNAYISSFPDSEDELIKQSWGNYGEIQQVIDFPHPLGRRMLQLVYEKDLRDVKASTLIDHLKNIDFNETSEYVINPRIALEKITEWRSFIRSYFPRPFTDGDKVAKWIRKNIRLNDEDNYYNVPISPEAVLKAKESDKKSREILFVAICRTFSLQARYEWATGRAQWRKDADSPWQYAFKEKKNKEENNSCLIVCNAAGNKMKPEYYAQFTLQRLIKNEFLTLDYEYDPKFNSFPETLQLPAGQYRLIAGSRNSKGQVKVRETYFKLEKGKTTKIEVSVPEIEEANENYGRIILSGEKTIISSDSVNFNSKLLLRKLQEKNDAVVLALIDPYKEPSRHLLADISKSKDAFDKYSNVSIVLVLDESLLNKDFSTSVFPPLPKNTFIVSDNGKQTEKQIIEATKLDFRNDYPILLLLEKENAVYLSQGYKISSQEEILKLLK
ncbi:MAG: transglutaminase domain-containing protein [Bacteroidales bacterium]|nr:transglutaminase domain-containing protein [Bacteroidales bacterium]